MSHRTLRPVSLVSAAWATGLTLSLTMALGCEAEVTPAGPPVAYTQVTAGPVGDDVAVTGDVDYVVDPPVDDIDAYPTAVYGGVTVYYVGGVWYRHDGHGWGRYLQEPPELAHQREAHASDPRWVAARNRQVAPEHAEPSREAQAPQEAAHPEVRPEEAARPAEDPKAPQPAAAAQHPVKRPAARPKREPEHR